MAKAPAHRYPTCADFADELAKAVFGSPTVSSTRPPPPAAPTTFDRRPRPARRRAVIAGVTAAALVAIGAAVLLLINPKPGPVKPSAASEVRAMNAVLTTSTTSRSPLQSLVSNVFQCRNLGEVIPQLQQIANQRSLELSKADGLSVGAIAGGATLKSELIKALKVSLRTDLDYILWAKLQQSGCPNKTGQSYLQQAEHGDQEATAAKQAFNASWNPVAQKYGYQTDPTF
ncbi:MAG TPA: hypothetical protein VFI65_12225 [Streptosporangiaceae bacterium]|nr:hypothetical protein [Streptosporangiaceae bacterium]